MRQREEGDGGSLITVSAAYSRRAKQAPRRQCCLHGEFSAEAMCILEIFIIVITDICTRYA